VVSYRRPCAARWNRIHHGISRKVKHISVITCVSGPGESLTLTLLHCKILPRSESRSKGTVFGSERKGFDHEIEYKAFHQCRNVFWLHPDRVAS
jgi:hypothetical protein